MLYFQSIHIATKACHRRHALASLERIGTGRSSLRHSGTSRLPHWCGLYPEIVKAGLRKGPIGSPMAYNSIFGWIVTGPTDIQRAHPDVIGSFKLTVVPMESISCELRKFWELEEMQLSPTLTPAEEQCEDYFHSTHRRDETGRFVVRLPLTNTPELPGSYVIAKQRFLSLERRLAKSPELGQQYNKFMQDYEDLHHMRKASPAQSNVKTAYIPHHAVVGKKLARGFQCIARSQQWQITQRFPSRRRKIAIGHLNDHPSLATRSLRFLQPTL
ncbi:unnamed protein product [Trichogramma brassicae]|uniref:Peptidase aspartic putative domain-containing protein n=1 Tax=Trichogramma brassicae TaxID=86971 RepID=A0A6H5HYF3_9HYME|nr:unnamed protein product [Trichogramma brassicae]